MFWRTFKQFVFMLTIEAWQLWLMVTVVAGLIALMGLAPILPSLCSIAAANYVLSGLKLLFWVGLVLTSGFWAFLELREYWDDASQRARQ